MKNKVTYLTEELRNKKKMEKWLSTQEGQIEKEWQDLSYKALVKPLSMAEQQRLVELSMDISKFITNKFYEAVELLEGARGKSDKYLEWALTQLEKEREDRFEVYEELDLMRIFITCDDKLSKEFEEFKKEMEEFKKEMEEEEEE